jgi:hypothetical protein
MNDSTNLSKGLLVLRIPQVLGKETVQLITDHIAPIADQLGLEPMVLDGGADVRIETGTSVILSRIADALERIVAQGEPPTVSEAEIAPQALNARSSGLNSRPAYTGLNGNGYQPEDRSGQIGGVNPMPPGAR